MPQLDYSAQTFLDRLDHVKDITLEHPIFLTQRPDDDCTGHIGLRGKPKRCCFTNVPEKVISINSHKAQIRQLAREYDIKLSKLPRQLQVITPRSIYNVLYAASSLIIQLARPFLVVLLPILFLMSIHSHIVQSPPLIYTLSSVYLIDPLSSSSSFIDNNDIYSIISAHLLSSHISLVLYGIATVWVLLSLRHDDMFWRDFLGWHSDVKHGIYYHKNDKKMSHVAQINPFLNGKRTYKPTPWLFNGDLRTAIPFGLFGCENIIYERRWISNSDGEAHIIDIAFPTKYIPKTGQYIRYHDSSKHIGIILHGLNGGSSEPYILDYCKHWNTAGHTVVVLVSRGLMGTPIVNGHHFNALRTSDLHNVVKACHIGAGNCLVDNYLTQYKIKELTFETCFNPLRDPMLQNKNNIYWNTPIVAAGFSLGAIIVSNYVINHGHSTGLLAGVGLAAAADCKRNMQYISSQRNWQGFLSFALKVNMIQPNPQLLVDAKLPIDIDKLEDSYTVIEFDNAYTAPSCGYPNCSDLYDTLSFGHKLKQLQTPLLLIHADDDPIIHVDTLKPCIDALDDDNTIQQYLAVLVTRGGGHVGSCEGMNPFVTKWEFLSTACLEFGSSVRKVFLPTSL